MGKRQIQEINAGSMADIAFLLLIFFLVATTMNVDTGINRVLPPLPEENAKEKPVDVKERNLLLVFVSKYDQIMVNNEQMNITQVKNKVKEFVLNRYNDEKLPEKDVTEIELIGQYAVSRGVVSLQNDRGTSYNMYIQVQNELTRAFNEARTELSLEKFNKKYEDLSDAQSKAIQKAIPLKISEAEPRNIEGER